MYKEQGQKKVDKNENPGGASLIPASCTKVASAQSIITIIFWFIPTNKLDSLPDHHRHFRDAAQRFAVC
jgi:hypothetical protein